MQFFSNREAARLSQKRYRLFASLSNPEKKIKLREYLLAKKQIPTVARTSKWHRCKTNIIKLQSNLNATDKDLEYQIKGFENERFVKEKVASVSEDEDENKNTKNSSKI